MRKCTHNIYGEKNWSWIKLISFHGLKLVNWEKMNGLKQQKEDEDELCAHTFDACVINDDFIRYTRFNRLNPYNSKLIGSTKRWPNHVKWSNCCRWCYYILHWLTHHILGQNVMVDHFKKYARTRYKSTLNIKYIRHGSQISSNRTSDKSVCARSPIVNDSISSFFCTKKNLGDLVERF